ncbi:MAG: tRNA (adenosine(37)-N6)-threonylcarbamoyltransferase complex transferase subunit TsaD [Eubacteriales bacterium]
MKLLAIETSCDETAAAVVQDGRHILSNAIASQIEMHRVYGGVVPELASRSHIATISQITKQALAEANLDLSQIDGIAVTAAPGLIGALLVGLNFAKGLAFGQNLPLIPVHHVRGHIASNYLSHPDLAPPFLCLCVSGGTTTLVEVETYTQMKILGSTRDDAVGECFDKVARVLGIGYPGGKPLDDLAQGGDPKAYPLPRGKVDNAPLDMSFSGLKTASINLIHNHQQKEEALHLPNFAASFSQAVCDVLLPRILLAVEKTGQRKLAIAGGVSANTQLRKNLRDLCQGKGISLYLPELSLCGDNAAMIGAQGFYQYQAGLVAPWDLNASATWDLSQELTGKK